MQDKSRLFHHFNGCCQSFCTANQKHDKYCNRGPEIELYWFIVFGDKHFNEDGYQHKNGN